MAGKQSATPRPLRESRPRRHFTLSEANRTLPLVRRIVSDIVRAHSGAADLQAKLEELKGAPDAALHRMAQKDLEEAVSRLGRYVDELEEVGCSLKDSQMGLIDFPGRHQGREVCLCWMLGEEEIAYWHEVRTGFSGRQPIATLQEAPTRAHAE